MKVSGLLQVVAIPSIHWGHCECREMEGRIILCRRKTHAKAYRQDKPVAGGQEGET